MIRRKANIRFCTLLATLAMVLLPVINGACIRNNQLKTNEISLGEKILQEERERDSLLDERKTLVDNAAPSVGITFIEDISVRGAQVPIVLDILKSREDFKELKLSEVTRDLQYLHLRIPNDTSFLGGGNDIISTPNYIYVKATKGLACFDRNGQFLKLICQTTTDHVSYIGGRNIATVSSQSIKLFYGSMGDVNVVGDKLYYLYKDYPNEINQFMMFDPSVDLATIPGLSNETGNKLGNPIGSVVRSFKMDFRGTNLYPLDEQTFGTIPNKLNDRSLGSIFVSKSYSGDTTCVFADYDPIEQYTNTVARGVESGDQYYMNGVFHLRPRFNDTVFTLEMPNRLIPKFVIDFGGKGVPNSLEALDPKFKLTDYFVHSEIIETQSHIFVQYTQDYSCPNTAKNGTLKYNRCVYSKRSKELIHVMVDASPVQQEGLSWPTAKMVGIDNDIDQGLDFWPDGITHEGTAYMRISGEDLKKLLNETGIQNRELKDLANKAWPNELIIILAK